MKFNLTQSMLAIGALVLAYHLGKQKGMEATAKVGPGQPGNKVDTAAEWWTFAGNWAG